MGNHDASDRRLLVLSPTGKSVAMPAGSMHGLSIRDVSTGEEVRRLSEQGKFRRLAFSPDGKMVAAVDGSSLRFFVVDGSRPPA